MLRLLLALFGLIILLIASQMVSVGDLIMFIHLPSLMIVTLVPLMFTLAHHSLHEVWRAISISCDRSKVSAESSIKHQAVLSTLRLSIASSGVIGSLVGIVVMLANMSDPKMIGPAMASTILSALYAVILSELFVAPLMNRIRSRSEPEQSSSSSPIVVSLFTLIHIPIIIVVCLVLLFSFAST